MRWTGEEEQRLLDWLAAGRPARYPKECRLDPLATSMRDFDDVSPHLRSIRDGTEIGHSDPQQRIVDLRAAQLVNKGRSTLSSLGRAVLETWETHGIANAEAGDELARHLVLVYLALDLGSPLYAGFCGYWERLAGRYEPLDLIHNWDALYVLNYLDCSRDGYSPGAAFNRSTWPISTVAEFASSELLSSYRNRDEAREEVARILKGIRNKVPRGRHRATFCCALEMVAGGAPSVDLILRNFGIPDGPREWIRLDDRHMDTVRRIAEMAGGSSPDGRAAREASTPTTAPDQAEFPFALVPPPRPREAGEHARPVVPSGFQVDYAARAARNKLVGDVGEDWALRFELWRLREHPELAKQVDHVSKTDDTAGYDISSFELDGSPRFVEVKSTMRGLRTPFFISAHEVDVAKEKCDDWLILRVFDLARSPRFCELRYPFEDVIVLTPSNYTATFR
jgi:hypothetical protein